MPLLSRLAPATSRPSRHPLPPPRLLPRPTLPTPPLRHPQAIPAAVTPPPAHEPTARVPAAGWRGDKAIEVEQAPPPRWWRDGLDSRAIGASLCAPLDTVTIRDAPAAARSRPPLPPSLRSSKNRRSPPHHWSPAPFGERLRRVQLASARVGDRRGGRYDRRRRDHCSGRDHRRAEDSISLFHVSATWPREESLLRQVPTWQIQEREYAPTHTCDMPEKLPETKTACAGSPRRSSRAQ